MFFSIVITEKTLHGNLFRSIHWMFTKRFYWNRWQNIQIECSCRPMWSESPHNQSRRYFPDIFPEFSKIQFLGNLISFCEWSYDQSPDRLALIHVCFLFLIFLKFSWEIGMIRYNPKNILKFLVNIVFKTKKVPNSLLKNSKLREICNLL